MKKYIYMIVAGLGIMVLTSCGGGGGNGKVSSSLPKNDYLGDLPAINDVYYKTDSILDVWIDEKQKDIKSEKDLGKFEKIAAEYKEKETANKKKREDAIAKTRGELMGKEIPFVNEDPRYVVSDLKITEIAELRVKATGTLKTVGINKKVTGSFPISFQARDTNDDILEKGAVYIEVKDADPYMREIPEGTELIFTLSIDTRDPASALFAKMVFVPI